jgi:(p)ppGpp synthase/HD superfamily hydrolase
MTQIDLQTIALIVTLVSMAGGGVWKLSRVEAALRKDINDAREDIESKQERQSREFGETVAAIRQKVHDVEMYAANNYVRLDGFYKVRDELREDIRELGVQLNKRLDKMAGIGDP